MPSASPSLVEIDPAVKLHTVLPDRIGSLIKQRILTCTLLPGQRLVEKELCRELGVSRTPLREALNRLVYEGLVVPMPYRGYAVAPLTLEGIRELCEVRRINEAEAAHLAAQRLTDADLRRLDAVAAPSYVPGDRASYATYLRTNAEFHLAVVRATRNSRLEAIVMAALDQLQRPEYLGLDLGTKNATQVASEHREIVEAFRARDAALARKLMVEHIARAEQRIVGALQATDFWKSRSHAGAAGARKQASVPQGSFAAAEGSGQLGAAKEVP